MVQELKDIRTSLTNMASGQNSDDIRNKTPFQSKQKRSHNLARASPTAQDFDSSDEDDEATIAQKLKDQNNDDFFYDSGADDEDEIWVEKRRKNIFSDAILTCPLCFTTVCVECQRHEKYKNQYRAIESINTKVISTERLRYGKGSDEEIYLPVRCNECDAEIGVFDEDEIYHFFHVIAEPV